MLSSLTRLSPCCIFHFYVLKSVNRPRKIWQRAKERMAIVNRDPRKSALHPVQSLTFRGAMLYAKMAIKETANQKKKTSQTNSANHPLPNQAENIKQSVSGGMGYFSNFIVACAIA